MADRAVHVTVVYKGGAKMEFDCEDFSAARNTVTGDLTKVEWTNARPKPFLFGLAEVAAIYVDEPDE